MKVNISDLVDGGRVYEFGGERSLTVVFPPDRKMTHFIVESKLGVPKTGIIPNMETLIQLLLSVDGFMDPFPEENLIIET